MLSNNTTSTSEQFEALFNNAAIGIIMVNKAGDIQLANQFALQQFGYSPKELIGQKIEMLIPKSSTKTHQKHRENYHEHNPHSRPMGVGMDLLGLRKNGTEFPVEVSLSVFNREGYDYAIAFISDITIRKESEDALRSLNEDLERKVQERTQSLEAALEKEKELGELKSRFVSMASHQFRTPLSTVLSSAYLLGQYKETNEQPKRDRHIDRIISSVNLLTDILNDFLSLGKIEEGKIQVRFCEIELNTFIESVLVEMRSIAKLGQEIVYENNGRAKLNLDTNLLKQILQNLVGNAIKFSPEKSVIFVKSTMANKQLEISIADKGMGISVEDKRQLFQRFFRATNANNIQGTGLGLHIVAKYAELMNGSIQCESELGKGSTFTLKFDLSENQ
ncbi:MAG: PAS domain-containing sensor histidine kinase [Chitinophagaceae bacterium]